MADPFVAEIRMFPFNFAPKYWAWCDGQQLRISQNTALFSLLGTTYGGDGRDTFALPDLQGRAPMHPGQGPGLSPRELGEIGGAEAVTLLESQMPAHSHGAQAVQDTATRQIPGSDAMLAATTTQNLYYAGSGGGVAMSEQSLTPAGGGQPHNNMQPYLTVYFCIALQGVFPPRS